MGDTSLRTRLGQVADLAGAGFEPPRVGDLIARRRSRHRTVATVTGAVVSVLGIALAAAVLGGSATREVALPGPHVPSPPGNVTATQLSSYRWAALPDAPIAVRSEGVVGVWTGTRMIVWGGDSRSNVYGDGASYDPATTTWQELPRSPLGPRDFAAYAWTGQRLFIWGGTSGGSDRIHTSGATYDPGTRTWHQLPRLAVEDVADATAVWTGDRVVLFTATGLHPTTVDAHAYDPASDSWSTLPSIHIDQTELLAVSALVVDDQLFVWMPVQTIGNGLRTGNDGFVYRPATNSWKRTSLLPTQAQYSVGNVLSSGDHVIFEPNGLLCSCGGIPGASTGSWGDPRTGTATQIPAWLPDRLDASTFSWTGAVVLAIGSENPRAAAWDPITGDWTHLADAPYAGGAVQIWTGTQLLIWGQLSARPSSDPSAGSPPQVAEPQGLIFKP